MNDISGTMGRWKRIADQIPGKSEQDVLKMTKIIEEEQKKSRPPPFVVQ